MRRRLGFLTTKNTNIHEISKIIDSKIIGSTEEEAGAHFAGRSGASEPDSLTSRLADSPASESLTRSASGSASSPATSHSLLATAPVSPLPATSYSPLATPASPDVVFLAFGQIRDGKNLDLFLRVMTHLPKHVKLLVAGKGDSGSSRPPEFYQNLAEELGVADRCRWDIRRIPEDEVGDIFAACDVVLVTYSAKFRSASGVLNAAVSARKLVLASSGSGPLKTVVEKYHLGVFVEPDAPEETLRGAQMLLDAVSSSPTQILDIRHSTLDACFPPATSDSPHDTAGVLLPAWDRYERENSWKENAKNIRDTFVPPH
jgi:glycosyltransferase involved in cell wall biosynthesis